MRYRVLMAKAQNKLYKPLPSDSVFQEVVDYYDSKGSANEKMQAHYLLGCIYRDQEEAPMAIKCYKEAVEYADTLSKDCDYTTLYSIYGQMADVFADQYLPKEAIDASEKSSIFALKAGDMHNYILGQELCIPYYYMLGDTAKVISQTVRCANLYKKNRMNQMAAQAYPTMIKVLIENKHFEQAVYYMNLFEKQSGLFDNHNNIQKGREYYYDSKAQFFYEIGKVDSAEFYYRKLLQAGWNYEATKGLLSVARYHENLDSVLKYSSLCGKSMDCILEKAKSDAVLRCVALYNYNRLAKIAEVEKYKNQKATLLSGFALFIFILVMVLLFVRYKKMQEKRKKKVLLLSREFRQSHLELVQAKTELNFIKYNQAQAVCELENKIQSLENKIAGYQLQYNSMKIAEKEVLLKENFIVTSFKKMASPGLKIPKPTEKEWVSLVALFEDMLPLLNARIIEKNSLGPQELKVCILTRLGFSNGEMQVLLGTSSQSITNTKAKINKKLFNKSGASTLYRNMLDI